MNFAGKKILFISASFFGYEKDIAARLQALGASVDCFDERPSNSVLTKGLIRVNRKLIERRITKYYDEILLSVADRTYDFFLLIKGESVPELFLERFKEMHRDTEMIFYSYDAISEYPRVIQLLDFFHRKITFEPKDAVQYGLEFRPLFFLHDYRKTKDKINSDLDIVFIGSAHTDRYSVGEKVRIAAEKVGLKTFFFYHAPGKTAFRLKKIFDKNLQVFDLDKLSFHKLSHSEISGYYDRSKAVLDINKPFQMGLTMRTFESLASQTKLITTNSDIVNYPFFNPANILLVNRENPTIDVEFLHSPFVQISEEPISKMSLDSWLHAVFFEEQTAYWWHFRT